MPTAFPKFSPNVSTALQPILLVRRLRGDVTRTMAFQAQH
jgi:hypothetical protein